MKYYCNPINVEYKYQFIKNRKLDFKEQVYREAADPSMICFKGRYYIFASVSLGVYYSDDLVDWKYRELPKDLPLWDYAPDARVVGDWVYICFSNHDFNCDRFRTKDILNGPYEKIDGTFPFWDPNLFADDDGRIYFYWGCSNCAPIFGVEFDPDTMLPKTEPKELIFARPFDIGYERVGDDNSITPIYDEPAKQRYDEYINDHVIDENDLDEEEKKLVRRIYLKRPYIEGAWVDKYKGKYYFQYAVPGTQYNTYCDGVYVGDSPLGPFRLAECNPFSFKPGGFIHGAGHGSTMKDRYDNLWHVSTMRISMTHSFERRIGLWPAGYDPDGEMYCDQRYGDWPLSVSEEKIEPWKDPEWMLLSYNKKAAASSCSDSCLPEKAFDEDIRTWWKAGSNDKNEWLSVDFGKIYDVRAIQVNFADDDIKEPCPGEYIDRFMIRHIDERNHHIRWKLEGSKDGNNWFVIEDKTNAETDLSHDLVVIENGLDIRYVKISEMEVPFGLAPCISGLRIFGKDDGELPGVASFKVERKTDLDMVVDIHKVENVVGYNILFGTSPEKLYNNHMVFTAGEQRIGALVRGRNYYVRVDTFNETGITKGNTIKL